MRPLARYTVLKNKYYFDELYGLIFVRPAYWLAETFTYLWVDRKVIDGFLHLIARITFSVGGFFRNFIDKQIVNGFGDFVGETVKRFGRGSRFIQTGRVQQYMVMALVIAFGTLFYYLFVLLQP
jgi:NADH-quinone oxidoreductase subunit L